MNENQMLNALHELSSYCQKHPGCKNCCFDTAVSLNESECQIKQYMTNEEGFFVLPYNWRELC